MRADALLRGWYAKRRRAYPWRRDPPDPYAVLVSEVMLQQTQAARVAPAFERFLARFPTVGSLAGASRADVVRAWAGLGYNRRAVALHETARAVVRDHGGRVPSDPRALRELPGVGPYTAAAVAAIAFGVPVAAVDTNVRRVAARFLLGAEAAEAPADELCRAVDAWLDRRAPGAWNQAVMDLGRETCRRRPLCGECPLRSSCRFRAAGRSGTRSAARRTDSFEGSSRQLRGRVVQALRERPSATPAELAAFAGADRARVAVAVASLAKEGLVVVGPRGRVRLPA